MIFYGFHGGSGFVVTLLYSKTHRVVNIQYVQPFICQSYLNKLVKNKQRLYSPFITQP